MAEFGHVGRDAATDAFWAGRWAGMASALACALRDHVASAGDSAALREYDQLRALFESPPFLAMPGASVREYVGRDGDG